MIPLDEGNDNNRDPVGSSTVSSTDELRYLSILVVLPLSSSPQELKLDSISGILDEVLLFWWENRDRKTDDKLVIHCRNNAKIDLVPMIKAKNPRHKNKNLKVIMKCAGDGDVVSKGK